MLQTLADRAKAHLSDYAITPYHTDGAPYLHNVEIDGLRLTPLRLWQRE